MKTYTNFKKIFLVRVFFWLKNTFRIKFNIPILDLMLLSKLVFHLKGYTPVEENRIEDVKYTLLKIKKTSIKRQKPNSEQ